MIDSFMILFPSLIMLCVGLILQVRRMQALEQRLNDLSSHMDMFVEASVNVARGVDQLMYKQGPEQSAPKGTASRRWILNEAQTRLAEGQAIEKVIAPLGLSRDEARLLRLSNRANAPQHRVEAVAASGG